MTDTSILQIHEFTDVDETIRAVNARDLYAFLEIRRDFSAWITEMIRSFGFTEGTDFTKAQSIPKNGEQTYQGVKTRIDYFLTLDTAKELSMVQRNARGKQARQYFIECEKRLRAIQHAPAALPDLSDPQVLTALLLEHATKRIEAEQRAEIAEQHVEAVKPKAAFYDQFANADGLYGLQNAARVLNQPPNKFIGWLKRSYLFYQGTALVPYVQYKNSGIFEVKAEIVDEKARYRTYVTARGIQYFARKFGCDGQTGLDLQH